MKPFPIRCAAFFAALVLFGCLVPRADAGEKPVLLYSRYFNAPGENRYPPDGAYSELVRRLGDTFEVRSDSQPLTLRSLAGVKVVLIANPNDKAVGTNLPPPHVSAADVRALSRFVSRGGGLIVMGNQEGHNLEVEDMNHLLVKFGLQFTNAYTDAKKLVLPADAPIIGGLRWAYYTGNQVMLTPARSAKPLAVAVNDLGQKPEKGPRDQAGILLAVSEYGRGRVVAVTDSGWVANWALDERGVGGVAIKGQDNWEICRRLTVWAAHLK